MQARELFAACCVISLLVLVLNLSNCRNRVSDHRYDVLPTPPVPRAKSKAGRTVATEEPKKTSSIFIYRAYYDDRAVKNTIRILAISKCLKNTNTTTTTLTMKANGSITKLDYRPLEGSCPWSWAKKCMWNAYMFQSETIPEAPDEVEIMLNDERSIKVKVEKRLPVAKDELQVCVPPLYYYHDWPRLILFFELWRKHNPASFIIYANSMSKNAEKVIEYYRAQDVVQLVHWPILPKTPDGEDPNSSIYRLSHSLAHNDCVLRMEAEYGVLLDVDEYIHLSDDLELLDYVAPRFEKDKKLGSLLFQHFGLKVGPLNGSFDGVVDAETFRNNRPTKTVFKPEYVKRLSTHWVTEHEPRAMKKKTVNVRDGKLLHYRRNFDEMQSTNATTPLSGINLEYVQWRAREAAKDIFGSNMPPVNAKVGQVMTKCLAKWRSHGCKVPLLHCKKDLSEADDWVFLIPSEDSHYTIL